jgi:hypothetical protein
VHVVQPERIRLEAASRRGERVAVAAGQRYWGQFLLPSGRTG